MASACGGRLGIGADGFGGGWRKAGCCVEEAGLRKIRKFVMVGAACGVAFSAAGAVIPSASAVSAPWSSQVVRPAAVRCPGGERLIAPTGARTDSLGVTQITYQADPGLVVSIPPKGLGIGGVTPAVMADMGIGARHLSRPSGLRLARQVVSLARNRTAPQFCWSKPAATSLRQAHPDLQFAHTDNPAWAGYAVTEAEHGGNINGATGSWAVPQSMTSSAPSAEATWVGVGGGLGEGSSVEGLIQDGSWMQTNEGYRTFWEYIGTSGCTDQTAFCGKFSSVNAVRPGTQISADVWWDTNTTATFLISTSAPGGSGSFAARNVPVNIPYDHTSAEWVNEWLGRGAGAFYDSPGVVTFEAQGLMGALGGQGSFTSPFAGAFEAVVMSKVPTAGTNCSDGNVISYPTNATNTSSTSGASNIVTCSVGGVDSP